MFEREFSDFHSASRLKEALELVRANSFGNVWLVGGAVYRAIANRLYGIEMKEADFDFIVEGVKNELKLSNGFTLKTNRFGNPKFVGEISIDFVPLANVYSIVHNQLDPKIENFLINVPLTVQSIAYDLDNERIVGDVGAQSLRDRTVAVNNFYFAEYAANKKGISVSEMIEKKASSLGFHAICPS